VPDKGRWVWELGKKGPKEKTQPRKVRYDVERGCVEKGGGERRLYCILGDLN